MRAIQLSMVRGATSKKPASEFGPIAGGAADGDDARNITRVTFV
jgi:hypothetical protein